MPLDDLTEEEKDVVSECLRCAAAGEVILHDEEFHTIMGVRVSELLEVVEQWPAVDDSQETVFLAINNSMNNLLGFPHGKYANWDAFLPVSYAEVERVYWKWLRGQKPSSD